EAVAELDMIKAKIEFARKFNSVVPEISDNGTLEFIDARHPLLEETLRASEARRQVSEHEAVARGHLAASPKAPVATAPGSDSGGNVVPISFAMTLANPVMIIPGANAGGKTVVLKTAGLLSLMAISGLPVPAKEARIPFYKSVLADIGDHQS